MVLAACDDVVVEPAVVAGEAVVAGDAVVELDPFDEELQPPAASTTSETGYAEHPGPLHIQPPCISTTSRAEATEGSTGLTDPHLDPVVGRGPISETRGISPALSGSGGTPGRSHVDHPGAIITFCEATLSGLVRPNTRETPSIPVASSRTRRRARGGDPLPPHRGHYAVADLHQAVRGGPWKPIPPTTWPSRTIW